MKKYKLRFDDFKRVFDFASKYYIDPSKNTTGRTTAEPRGLGAILDAFTLGKITEIGVEKIFYELNNKKQFFLDFDIKKNSVVKNDPDIVGVFEDNINRDPNIFIEVKNTSEGDRWIGLTEEQFGTIKRSAGGRKIYFIYASIFSKIKDLNPKTADLTGMFLKEIEDQSKSKIFQSFANLNAECKIEFVLSSEDFEKFGFHFEKGMNMYETRLFEKKNKQSFYAGSGLRKDVLEVIDYSNFNNTVMLEIERDLLPEKENLSRFNVSGSFKLFKKKKKNYIECISNVIVKNEVFGSFNLEKGSFYGFNLSTLGRDPKLKRNNIFIAKNRVLELIRLGFIRNPEEVVREIVEEI
jgi:hypothetical protein